MPGAAFLDDWGVACSARANVLIVGPTGTTAAVVRESRAALSEPVISSLCTDALVLPSADLAGTLVLHDVGRLALVDQLRLTMFLETTHAQVISTSPEPLLPLVQAGLFLELLYYRLNTICLEASAVANGAEAQLGERVRTPAGTGHSLV
jgi:hypothetical protein